jgi:hypothetical protein
MLKGDEAAAVAAADLRICCWHGVKCEGWAISRAVAPRAAVEAPMKTTPLNRALSAHAKVAERGIYSAESVNVNHAKKAQAPVVFSSFRICCGVSAPKFAPNAPRGTVVQQKLAEFAKPLLH